MIDGEELIVMLDKAEMGAMQDRRNHAYRKGLRDAIKMTRILLDAEEMDLNVAEEYEGTYYCGNCKSPVLKTDKYCHECGKKVRWE